MSSLSEFYGTGSEFLRSGLHRFHLWQKTFKATPVPLPSQPQSVSEVKVTVNSGWSVPRHTLSVCQDMKVKGVTGGGIPANKPAEKLPRPCSRWPSRIVFPPQNRRWHTFRVRVHSSRQSMWPRLASDCTSGQTLNQNIKPSDFQQLAHHHSVKCQQLTFFTLGLYFSSATSGRKVKQFIIIIEDSRLLQYLYLVALDWGTSDNPSDLQL